MITPHFTWEDGDDRFDDLSKSSDESNHSWWKNNYEWLKKLVTELELIRTKSRDSQRYC
jgi:hypothetical protein